MKKVDKRIRNDCLDVETLAENLRKTTKIKRTDKCLQCNGEMRVDDYENDDKYSIDGKMPCPTCYGSGEIYKEINDENKGR